MSTTRQEQLNANQRRMFGCLSSVIIEDTRANATPPALIVMSVLSDCQEFLECIDAQGDGFIWSVAEAREKLRWYLNSSKLIIDEFCSIKDEQGRHIKAQDMTGVVEI